MIYIHVPFCRSFCSYCDFYSEILCDKKQSKETGAWLNGICREAASRKDEISASAGVNTLYFGGGTPSVLPPSAFSAILLALGKDSFDEFTVEVNPDDIVSKGVDYVKELADLGVNRISMGVQSLDDQVLRWMNRRHDAASAIKAFDILRSGRIGNISVDFIFGASCMTDAMVEAGIRELAGWGPEHISAYQLSIEEGSSLAAQVRRGDYHEADEQFCRRQYDLICDILSGSGFHHYEISNWARPGREAVHNSAYWDRVPYVGLGPGAHSFRINPDGTEVRSWNSEELQGWSSSSEILSEEDIRTEVLMLGLRTDKGVPSVMVDHVKAGVMLSDGRLERNGDRLRIAGDYLFVSDSIITELL